MDRFTNGIPNIVNYFINYNSFFHPNVCHVCKSSNYGNLLLCRHCCMISYCSDAHRQVHYPQHVQFCKYITEYLRQKSSTERRFLCLSPLEWIRSRQEFLCEIMQQIPRTLTHYEIQMILFAKSCRICHRQKDLHTCQRCHSDNYCIDHEERFRSHHAPKCHVLKIYFNLNILDLTFMEFPLAFSKFPEQWRSVDDMDGFIAEYIHSSFYRRFETDMNIKYLYSDYVSGPLTLYDGIKHANLLELLKANLTGSQYIVHIISANLLERRYVKAWELFLHCLTCIKQLIIVLIGSGLEAESEDIRLCLNCTRRNQKLRFQCYPMSYYQYMDSSSFLQPNVIVKFDTHLGATEYNLLISRSMNCPYIITSGSQLIAEQSIHNIHMVLGVTPAYHKLNNFRSFRPWKQLHIDYIGYRNLYITVYRNLYS